MRAAPALVCIGLAATVIAGGALPAAATTISVGSRIAISPTTFALPVEIVDGANVSSWQFDLTYDATDVQVNTACDPFSGDVYCSLLTGAVTEGDFFASGDPFNLLNPGFVALDPATLAQPACSSASTARMAVLRLHRPATGRWRSSSSHRSATAIRGSS